MCCVCSLQAIYRAQHCRLGTLTSHKMCGQDCFGACSEGGFVGGSRKVESRSGLGKGWWWNWKWRWRRGKQEKGKGAERVGEGLAPHLANKPMYHCILSPAHPCLHNHDGQTLAAHLKSLYTIPSIVPFNPHPLIAIYSHLCVAANQPGQSLRIAVLSMLP